MDDIDKVAVIFLSISEDITEARQSVELSAKNALIVVPDILKHHGYKMPAKDDFAIQSCVYTKERLKKIEESLKDIPMEAVERISALGTAEDCIEKIGQYIEAGANHLVFHNFSPDVEMSMNVMKDKVIPYFKEKAS